jgi:hypothetical protein
MSHFDEDVTHAVILTVTNDSAHVARWESRADEIAENPEEELQDPGRLRFVKDGAMTMRDAVRFELADEIADHYEHQADAIFGVPDVSETTVGLFNTLLQSQLAQVDWTEVAEEFMPESV